MDNLLPPSSFGLRQKKLAKETGFFLLTSDLRQKVLAGNEHGRALGAAPHPDIHLQKVHLTATPFTPLLFLKREIEGNRGNDLPNRPAFPQLAGKNEKSRSRPVSLSLGKEQWRCSPGATTTTGQTWSAGSRRPPLRRLPAPPSKASSLQVTSCPLDTVALADSRALSSKADYSLGAQPSVLQRAEAARFRQPAPRAIDQGLLNPYPASTFYPSARLRSQNTSSFCHFSSKLLIRSFS